MQLLELAVTNIVANAIKYSGNKPVSVATYSLYTHFTLIFFILLLPFALIDVLGFMEIPLVVAIASSFLLIEKMGINLQDPFENKPTDTPVTTIARNIEKDLRQQLHEQFNATDEQVEAGRFYGL